MPGNVPANVELRGICIDSHIAEHHKRIFLAATRHYPLFSVFSRQNRTFFPTVFCHRTVSLGMQYLNNILNDELVDIF